MSSDGGIFLQRLLLTNAEAYGRPQKSNTEKEVICENDRSIRICIFKLKIISLNLIKQMDYPL